MKFLRFSLLSIALFFALLFFSAGVYFVAVTKDAVLDEKKLVLSDKTLTVYDQNGLRVQGNLANVKQSTPISMFPNHVKMAFVCVEDKRFFTHDGFDYRRFARAFLNNCKSRSYKEGASTISQQLIKNTHLSQEKTLKRKLKEWKLTRALERAYTKDEILEKYLNTIYFGHGCFGITSASDFYFGKSPDALSIDESAILAGLLKSPNNFSPFRFPSRCQERKATVLRLMQAQNVITKEEQKSALNAPLPLSSYKNDGNGYLNFVLDELSILSEKIGFTVGGKTEIFTYLDPGLQEKITQVSPQEGCDSAVVVLDVKTNGFKGAYSTIANAKRLPGSLIKPLLVYAPAIENDFISPASSILDEPINVNGYAPKNYDGKSYGYVSVRECVEKSLNIPAVKTLQALGIEKAASYLERLHLPVEEGDKSLALALGGMRNGYALKDVVSAYSVFANQGVYQDGAFISKIKINGENVYVRKNETQEVFSKASAYLMTDILKSTVQNGTAKKLRTLPVEIAGKTGTVGTAEGNTDAYTVSYTTHDVVGVWLGKRDNAKIVHTGGEKPCEIALQVNAFLIEQYTQKGSVVAPFSRPSDVVSVALDKTEYERAQTLIRADKNAPAEYTFSELFKRAQAPIKESRAFSCPVLSPPLLRVDDKGVEIVFEKNTPHFYECVITRKNGKEERIVYDGNVKSSVLDDGVKPDCLYEYFITPRYKNFVGETLVLPSISTKPRHIFEGEILSKEWWKE